MPSLSLAGWLAGRSAFFDDLEHAHRTIRGTGSGARAANQQINQAYTLMLSAQFQGFCRDLHSECASLYVAPVADPDLRQLLFVSLILGRKIDRGNPNAGNIGSDYNRLISPSFWAVVDSHQPRNPMRKGALEDLNVWRNAIAHQDFAPLMLTAGQPSLTLSQVQSWRKACDGLARSFDAVLRNEIQKLTGVAPW